ncbi:MAG: right-handed parallel beta-helix repeat-containing protein, partial [Planctomycetes bacterium]|nr:right-handed parallel beta-helix repeat-containing protein [Planctomycetota bacterium]
MNKLSIFTMFLACLFVLGLSISATASSITVSGDVSGTWDADSVLVAGEITVPDGQTLTINPGTLVEFQGHYKFNVQGQLLAQGTEQDSIVFTVSDTTGFSNPEVGDGGWHSLRFINTPASNDSSLIEYCRIEYGKALLSGFVNNMDKVGGGICVSNFGKIRISHSLIRHNSAYGDSTGGGGIAIWNGANAIVSHNAVIDNTIYGGYFNVGGGISVAYNSMATIWYNDISNNNVLDDGLRASGGGGIAIAWNSNSNIHGNTISDNYVYDSDGTGGMDGAAGGGIAIVFGCNPSITNNIIDNNQCAGPLSYAGGIDVWENCDPYIAGNTISNNQVDLWGGGVLIAQSSDPVFVNNIVTGNQVNGTTTNDGAGGGFFMLRYSGSSPNPILINNLIADNIVLTGDGGGVSAEDGCQPILINNTIANNQARNGGGIRLETGSDPTITNTILWGNTAAISGDQVYLLHSTNDPNFYYCDIQGGVEAFGGPGSGDNYQGDYENNLDFDPLFLDAG